MNKYSDLADISSLKITPRPLTIKTINISARCQMNVNRVVFFISIPFLLLYIRYTKFGKKSQFIVKYLLNKFCQIVAFVTAK